MEIFDSLNQALKNDQPVALCTIVQTKGAVPRHAGARMLVYADAHFEGTVGGGKTEKLVIEQALAAIKDGKTRFLTYDLIDAEKGDPGICGGTVAIFVEPFQSPPTVVVVGAGHVGRSVVHLASWLGYRVVVSDDRAELCTPEATPGGDLYLPIPMKDIPTQLEITPQTYLVLVTRGVEVDVSGLPALLDTPASYIGLIGSQRRWAHAREKLLQSGITEEQIARIKSPVGLNIHAETPDEIAVSIMAEITACRNTGNKQSRNA